MYRPPPGNELFATKTHASATAPETLCTVQSISAVFTPIRRTIREERIKRVRNRGTDLESGTTAALKSTRGLLVGEHCRVDTHLQRLSPIDRAGHTRAGSKFSLRLCISFTEMDYIRTCRLLSMSTVSKQVRRRSISARALKQASQGNRLSQDRECFLCPRE
jgi:hypothetical protein